MGIQLFCATFDVDSCLEQVRECLEKGWTGMGFKTVQFEEEWKKYTGLKNAYFLNSATAGLNLAVDVLKEKYGWADGDEVITTPNTFVSTNHAILLANMKPIFADIDDTLCLDPVDVAKKITPKTKAVIFVGFGGNMGHYDQIVKLCAKNNLKLIIDGAHIAGTRVNGLIPGKEADVVVYSFQAVKNLPTGDSGIICFRDEELDATCRKKAWLGINKDTYARSVNAEGAYKWKYDVEYVGNKYNGNAIMAAIALAQLPHLDRDNAYRRQMSQWYTEGFKPYPDRIKLVNTPANCESSHHLFQILVDDRDGLLSYMNKHDIYPGVHYIDNTEYRMYSYAKGTCPNAAYVSNHVMSLPLHMRLSYEDIQAVIKAVVDYVNK